MKKIWRQREQPQNLGDTGAAHAKLARQVGSRRALARGEHTLPLLRKDGGGDGRS
jgi:hypothetical protein